MESQDSVFHVYYREFPHKNLRVVAAHHETAGEAIKDVAEMLKGEKEAHYKPLLAMIIGGKSV